MNRDTPDPSSTGHSSLELPRLTAPVHRRDFLKAGGLSLGALMLSRYGLMAGPFTAEDFRNLVPLDKKLTPEWIASLTARGEPWLWSGDQLRYIGMPCNGIGTGQVYLSGDGRLWHWGQLGAMDGHVKTSGPRYKDPDTPDARFPIHGAGVKVTAEDGTIRYDSLDHANCSDVTFTPRWPMGNVSLRTKHLAVAISGWTPFIPGAVEQSSWPLSALNYRITNTSGEALEVELAVWLENQLGSTLPAGFAARKVTRVLPTGHPGRTVALRLAEGAAETGGQPQGGSGNRILFAGFEGEDYGDWTVEGTAFGQRPMRVDEVPAIQSLSNVDGKGLANSFNGSDAATGKLRSPEFVVEHPYICFLIAGGNTSRTRMDLLVDGQPVRRIGGKRSDTLEQRYFDVREFMGKNARLEIVDESSGDWGHIDIDRIEFSDTPPGQTSEAATTVEKLSDATDFGDMALSILGEAEGIFSGTVDDPAVAALFDARKTESQSPLRSSPRAVVGRRCRLAPGESIVVPVAVSWRFERAPTKARNFYATRWPDAVAAMTDFARQADSLRELTLRWVRTWYEDSSLPWWMMQRAIIPLDCLQTNTTFRLADREGRYHLYEGVTCCEGNCTHVWHYAQAMAYIFPEIERDCREHIELELGQSEDGRMAMRWTNRLFKNAPVDAVDGTSGTILRILREHRMSADDRFLRRVWPDTKRALERQIADYDQNADGILTGGQHNTLDAAWWGKIPWITGMHLAALQAAALMADEVGDTNFAARCREQLESGEARFNEVFFDSDKGYFVMRPDPNRPKSPGTFEGCHIDQVLGQGWADLLGLPRVLPEAETRKALQAIWKNNFTPDVGPFRKQFPRGRWYSMPGEAGTLLTTFPEGGAEDALERGVANHSAYMNETMTGFEWQVGAHMVAEGMLTEGLSVGKAVSDRYAPERRNPFNEIECSDHYSRAMASYGMFLNICGFQYDGPAGYMQVAPLISPGNFRAPFTAAEGWGTLIQTRQGSAQSNSIEMKYGRLRLRSLGLGVAASPRRVEVQLDGKSVRAKLEEPDGDRCNVVFEREILLSEQSRLEVRLS